LVWVGANDLESAVKLFFDGGCQPNPGNMEVGVVANGKLYHERNLGHGTNNVAEWIALLYAMKVAESLGETTDVELWGDSMLVVNQANGTWKCKAEELKGYLAEFHAQKGKFTRLRIRHVRRAQNLAGIALEKALKG
jgi:ribonuclease HI